MSEGSEQPQQYCGYCGAEIRSNTRFCVSCGASLSSDPSEFNQANSESSEQTSSNFLWTNIQNFVRRIREGVAGSSGSRISETSNKMIRWFENLPVALKMSMAVMGALVLLVLVSPLALLVAALLLGVSVVAVIIRIAQHGPIKGWSLLAGTSLILLFLFGGFSNVIYGIEFFGGDDTTTEGVKQTGGFNPDDAASNTSSNPALEGIDTSNPVWAFDVTCAQLEGNGELKDAVAQDLAEVINTPLGPQAAIDSVKSHLETECIGVDPQYAPGSRATDAADEEVGGY